MALDTLKEERERAERRLKKINAEGGSFFIPAEVFADLDYDAAAHYDVRDDSLEAQSARSKERTGTIESVDKFNIERIVEHFPNVSQLKVLDVGCAEGERTVKYKETLQDRGYEIEVIGVDISPVKCAKAREVLGVDNVYEGNMVNLPFEDGNFDVVLNLYGGVSHSSQEDMSLTLREFYRVLRSNGVLCIDLLGRDIVRDGDDVTQGELWGRGQKSASKNRNYIVYKNPGEPIGVAYMFNEDEVRELITGSGLTVKEIGTLRKEDTQAEYLTFSVKE